MDSQTRLALKLLAKLMQMLADEADRTDHDSDSILALAGEVKYVESALNLIATKMPS